MPEKFAKKEIESLVQARQSQRVLAIIRAQFFGKMLQEHELILVADWLKRLGMYKESLRFLQKQYSFSQRKKEAQFRSKILLEFARLYYTLGANSYASKILLGLRLKDWNFYKISAENALANFQYEAAKTNFELYLSSYPHPDDYSCRVTKLSYADSLVGLNEYEQAITVVKNVMKNSPEPMLLSLTNSCIGEYLARQRRYQEALPHLEKALLIMPNDLSMDAAILRKWLGFTLFSLGKKKRGIGEIHLAKKMLQTLGHRVEALIDISVREFELGLLSKQEFGKRLLYPGLNNNFLDEYKSFLLEGITAKNNQFRLDLAAGEYFFNDVPKLGIPLELRCLAQIRLAENFGISLYRLIALLWPDDYFAADLLENRVFQIFRRLKKQYKIEIIIKDGVCSLPQKHYNKIGVVVHGSALPSLFQKEASPSALEIQSYYNVSRSQSWIIKKNFGS